MAHENEVIDRAAAYVNQLLKEQLPEWALYHNLDHTKNIVRYSEEIGSAAKLSKTEMEIVWLAAWFYDTGYTSLQNGHEAASCTIAGTFLKEQNYPQEKIDEVLACLQSAKTPPAPLNLMQEVFCDAVTLHVGKKKFDEKNNLFRTELERRSGTPLPEIEWINRSIDFISKHKYFTKYAQATYADRRTQNLVTLQERLREAQEEKKFKEEKLLLKKDNHAKPDDKSLHWFETMIRMTAGNHIHFSSIADHKASMLISTNSLMMTLIVTLYGRGVIGGKEVDHPPLFVLVPIFVLMAAALMTIIFAVISTIPKITSGLFTREDVEKKSANLLFFGNFYNMQLDDFLWAMDKIKNDKSYLYKMMTEDVYNLGKVLGKKFKYLRISYRVFMFGLIGTLITFVIMYVFFHDIG